LVSIGPQGFDVLIYLISNRERVVSKDDLIDAVWRGRTVSESTLASQINAVRKSIGDNGEDQKLVRTIARASRACAGCSSSRAIRASRTKGDPLM
jgi:DNA-binding winged helix-turn-helix (wHTH) protein